jgi:hypothetical protein
VHSVGLHLQLRQRGSTSFLTSSAAALEARDGGRVVVSGCAVTRGATGVAARGNGAVATLCRACRFEGLGVCGALAANGGTFECDSALRGEDVQLGQPAGAPSVLAQARRASSAQRCRRGFMVMGADAMLRLTACVAQDSLDCGVLAFDSALVELQGCLLAGSQREGGVSVLGSGTRAILTKCTADGNAACGVLAADGARAELRDCALTGSVTGSGLHVRGAGTRGVAIGCFATGNADAGVLVACSARVKLRSCKFAGTCEKGGLLVQGAGSKASANSCTSDGKSGKIASVDNGAEASLQDCSLRPPEAQQAKAEQPPAGKRTAAGSIGHGLAAIRGRLHRQE